ncbi:MAG: hypothetical protein U1E87_07125 [Alphaproteobacteria bacterium]
MSASYVRFREDMGWANVGSLNASIIGTWLDMITTTSGSGARRYDCAGF